MVSNLTLQHSVVSVNTVLTRVFSKFKWVLQETAT